jgi:dolichol-phosphate mannosyltransferase
VEGRGAGLAARQAVASDTIGARPLAGTAPPRGRPPDVSADLVSVIVPTWNERENIGPLLEAICKSLTGVAFEVLVVDDASPDGTAEAVHASARQHECVQLVERAGKLGLSSAVLEGAARCDGRVIIMMDADFSHDPGLLPALLREVQAGTDVAIGSRYAAGGDLQGWPLHRRLGSRLVTGLARWLLRLEVRDPLSGFAAFRREVLENLPTRFSGRGFKLLLEVLATQPGLRVSEIPITFVDRTRGASKLDVSELREFAMLCWRLRRWRRQGRAAAHHQPA